MSQFDKFKKKKELVIDEEPVQVNLEPVKIPKPIIIKKEKKPETKTTIHKDKEFTTDRKLDKTQIISKMFEIIQVHKKLIPIETLRSSLLHYDLLAHRKQLKK